jgi:hypothetical protein
MKLPLQMTDEWIGFEQEVDDDEKVTKPWS